MEVQQTDTSNTFLLENVFAEYRKTKYFLASHAFLKSLSTFTATPLKKSISHCQAYIYFIVFIDLLDNLLIIIFLDIWAYHISLKRAFYAEKSDIQHIYLPLKLSPITRDIPVYP